MVAIVLTVGLFFILWDRLLHFVLPVVFISYLVYGFVRPRISRAIRKEIEEEGEDDLERAD
jgi:CDP-diacylglycerol--serine O-phosphatidyltransferase